MTAQTHQSFFQMYGETLTADTVAAPSTALLHAGSTRNLGDAAIMAAVAEMSPERHVSVALGDNNPINIPGLSVSSNIGGSKRYVSVGGDIFHNDRPWLCTRAFLESVRQLSKNANKTIVFGQTIPTSCGWLGLRLLTTALHRARAVVVRDRESYGLLRRSGIDVDLAFDAAFGLTPTDSAIAVARTQFAALNVDPNRTVLLSVRSCDTIPGRSANLYYARMARLADLLVTRGHQVVVLVQSAANTNDSDSQIAYALKRDVPEVQVMDLFAYPGTFDRVAVLIGVMAIANIVVSARYHGAVLRLVSGRQPYHLHTSQKSRDLHTRLGLTGCALDHFHPDDAIPAIEATAAPTFNATPIRDDVRNAFDRAYAKIA
ncbi:MAG: polysaccharide pyruvyl transferase family protein [Pseudomonadota bacterium]